MKKQLSLLLLTLFCLPALVQAQNGPFPEPLSLLEQCEQKYQGIRDYTAVFIKEQRIRGDLKKPETIFIKFQKPFSLYMKWIKNPDKGKEVIFVEGENDNKLVAHLGGLIGLLTPTTIRLEPTHPIAMSGNLKPITQAGLGNLIDSIMRVTRLAAENGDLKMVCDKQTIYEGRPVFVVERFLPAKAKYPNTYSLIYVDKELLLPIYYEAYNADKELLQRYAYQDLKLDVGLTQSDFDKDNPDYKYPLF